MNIIDTALSIYAVMDCLTVAAIVVFTLGIIWAAVADCDRKH